MRTVSIVSALSSAIPALVLVAAGVSKAIHLRWFVKNVASHEIVPLRAAGIAAIAVVALELLIGIAVLTRAGMPWSVYAALGLFTVFGFVIARTLRQGMKSNAECGCIKVGSRTMKHSRMSLARLVSLAGLLVLSMSVELMGITFDVSVFVSCLLVVTLTTVMDLRSADDHGATAVAVKDRKALAV